MTISSVNNDTPSGISEVLASSACKCSQRTPYRSPRGMGYANGIMDNT